MRIFLITARIPPTRCGVGDYTVQVATEMSAMGHSVTILTSYNQSSIIPGAKFRILNILKSWGLRGMHTLRKTIRAEKPDVVYVQWVSQLYNKFGINLSLPFSIFLLGLTGVRIRIVVHEPWVGFESLFLWLIGPIQRLGLGLMILVAERTSVSIEKWTTLLKIRFFWKASTISWIPVGSNFPVCPLPSEQKDKIKSKYAISDSTFVVGLFGVNRTPNDVRVIERIWNDLRKRDHDYCLLAMGLSSDDVANTFSALKNDQRIRTTGFLTPEEVSYFFQVINVFICPFVDGVSTRRTTAIAALAHGVPVLTNGGKNTDRSIFDYSPIIQVAYYAEDFAKAIDRLRRSPKELTEIGRESKAFYLKHFQWSDIVEKLMDGLPKPHTNHKLSKSA